MLNSQTWPVAILDLSLMSAEVLFTQFAINELMSRKIAMRKIGTIIDTFKEKIYSQQLRK